MFIFDCSMFKFFIIYLPCTLSDTTTFMFGNGAVVKLYQSGFALAGNHQYFTVCEKEILVLIFIASMETGWD